ncbi:hypothetical protein BCR44DRAFT_1463127 [Catenaria anguillulae PL171]|uniref:Uncharacterized protein n=1 Tax=Catenaria anguillulae PL171 TaxID=765915 RepID=A0A1Y2HCX9_9FUNG|nr:hypothetical protein BCR44DRAFT_1463127 [Catenaria anguillulae PL171]
MTWSLTRLPSRSRSLKSLTRSKRASTTTTLDPVNEAVDDDPAPPLPAHDPLVFADPLSLPVADPTNHVMADSTVAVGQEEMVTDTADSPTIVSSKVSSKSGHDDAELPVDVTMSSSDINPATQQLDSALPSAESSLLESVTAVECKAPTREPSNASRATNITKAKLVPLTRQPSSAATSVAPSVSLEDLVSTLFSSARAANIRTDDPPPSLSATPQLSTSTLFPASSPDVHTYLPSTMRHDPSATSSRRHTTLRSASLSRHNGSTHSVVLVSTTTTTSASASDASESATPTTLAHAAAHSSGSPASTYSSALLDHPAAHAHASPSGMVVRAAIDAVEHRVTARCAVLENENAVLRAKIDRLETKAKAHDETLQDLSARVAALLDTPFVDTSTSVAETMSLGRHRGNQVAGVLRDGDTALASTSASGRLRAGSVGSLGLCVDAGGKKRDKGGKWAGETASVKGFASPRTVNGGMMEDKDAAEGHEDKDKEREKARKKKNRFRSWF